MNKEQVENLLNDLNEFAYSVHKVDYGLPMDNKHIEKMIDIVQLHLKRSYSNINQIS